ncbi:hypothetical protein PanWU01x14_238850 [Parasponia andersonii]|uniref:Uncharacterized protein n=1 Tax=Parasponia andersonii TaxID=3476 RepID=A0A2P5BHG8_PARAD|nr:hypothetical protein PanWU01x14_238850 [Parasponia andersonii]
MKLLSELSKETGALYKRIYSRGFSPWWLAFGVNAHVAKNLTWSNKELPRVLCLSWEPRGGMGLDTTTSCGFQLDATT